MSDSTSALLPPSANPAYVAALHLPTGLTERIAAASESVRITFTDSGRGSLTIGDEVFEFASLPEENCDCVRAEAEGLRVIGGVHEKLTVRPSRESASAARAQLAKSKLQAEDARKERTTLEIDATKGAPQSKRVKTTVKSVAATSHPAVKVGNSAAVAGAARSRAAMTAAVRLAAPPAAATSTGAVSSVSADSSTAASTAFTGSDTVVSSAGSAATVATDAVRAADGTSSYRL